MNLGWIYPRYVGPRLIIPGGILDGGYVRLATPVSMAISIGTCCSFCCQDDGHHRHQGNHELRLVEHARADCVCEVVVVVGLRGHCQAVYIYRSKNSSICIGVARYAKKTYQMFDKLHIFEDVLRSRQDSMCMDGGLGPWQSYASFIFIHIHINS